MEWWSALLVVLGGGLCLMFMGVPVAFALLMANIGGAILLWGGEKGLLLAVKSLDTSITSFTFLPFVMYTLMGDLLFQSGVGARMLDGIDRLLGRLPGRLAVVAIGMSTLMAVLTGATLPTVVLLGKSLTPEMERRGYKKPMSLGPVMGGATLAPLIPPSGPAIIIGGVGQMSIAALLIGGILPGLLLALLFGLYIIVRCWLQPSLAPAYDFTEISLSARVKIFFSDILPVGIVIFMVLGTMFLGIATPTEAAALGVVGSICLIARYRALSWKGVKGALLSTSKVSVMVLIVVSSAAVFSNILAFSGVSQAVSRYVASATLSPYAMVGAVMVIGLIMGMFLPGVAIIMILIPLFLPIIKELGFNPIWFGLLLLLNVEIGGISPPLGGVIFAMKAVAPEGTSMADIWKAGMPFLWFEVLVMGLMILFPEAVLWLPGLMQ